RNEKGRLRIGGISVSVTPVLADPADAPRLDHCREIFEDFCVVTQSVRGGTPVTVVWGDAGSPSAP
ncbi:OsmC family protein, partial [mine drainage metagenome]